MKKIIVFILGWGLMALPVSPGEAKSSRTRKTTVIKPKQVKSKKARKRVPTTYRRIVVPLPPILPQPLPLPRVPQPQPAPATRSVAIIRGTEKTIQQVPVGKR